MISVGDLNLSVRAMNCLAWGPFYEKDKPFVDLYEIDIGRLAVMTSDELLRVKNLGMTTLREIQEELARFGRRLRDYPRRYFFEVPKLDTENMPLDATDKTTHYTLTNRFSYHPPTGDQPARYQKLRETALAFAQLIVEACPASAERSTSLTHLDAAVMFANAAIARNETTE